MQEKSKKIYVLDESYTMREYQILDADSPAKLTETSALRSFDMTP